jgi:hypothetical protein
MLALKYLPVNEDKQTLGYSDRVSRVGRLLSMTISFRLETLSVHAENKTACQVSRPEEATCYAATAAKPDKEEATR